MTYNNDELELTEDSLRKAKKTLAIWFWISLTLLLINAALNYVYIYYAKEISYSGLFIMFVMSGCTYYWNRGIGYIDKALEAGIYKK